MAGGGEAKGISLEYTPTWVVAVVCSVIVFISFFLERILHYLGKAYTPTPLSISIYLCIYLSIYLYNHLVLCIVSPAASKEEEPKASLRSLTESQRRLK